MHRTVAAGSPTSSTAKKITVRNFSDVNLAAAARRLRVAFQTKIGIRLDEQLAIDRAVRVVASDATFAHCFVLKNKRSRLLAMTLRATFVLTRHRQTAGGFKNIRTVWIVALHAIHFVFENEMMMRQLKFRVRFEMTLKTGGGIFARIDNKLSSRRRDVLASWTVARFATGSTRQFLPIKMNSRMNATDKFLRDRRVAIGASFVADVSCAGNFERHQNRRIGCGT